MRRIPHAMALEAANRERLLSKVERLTELPLMVLSFVMVPLLVGPFLWDLSAQEEATFAALDGLIWAVFAIDLAVKVAIAPARRDYIKRHWLDVIIVAIPFFRPLRILRILVYGSRAFVGTRRLAQVDFLLVYAIGLVIVAATIVTSVEGEDAQIKNFPDALWWGIVTITTVGYGDIVPESQLGRAVAYVLMIAGIGLFSALTANLATLFIRPSEQSSRDINKVADEVRALREEIQKLRSSQGG